MRPARGPAAPAAGIVALFGILTVLLAASGCQSGYDMRDDPKYKPYAASELFPDSASARPLAPGVVPRYPVRPSSPNDSGMVGDRFLDEIPLPVTAELLARGRERFDIYCTPCHGYDGFGHGMVVARGLVAPPSLHADSVVTRPVGFYFRVMTDGLGRMPSYAVQVAPADRWAIAAWIRALQLSQRMAAADLPAEDRGKLSGGAP